MFRDANAYERFMGRWSRIAAPQFVDFADPPLQGRILDVGSGTGSLAFAIAERDKHVRVVGIEPSDEYVAYAGSRAIFPDRVSFEKGDAQQLRFPDASFDAALSLFAFNFIPDPKKGLSELHRVTRPKGKVSAAVWDYGDGMEMLRTFWDAAKHVDPEAEKLDEKHMPLCRAGELTKLWAQARFEDVREQPLDFAMGFESLADYWEPFLLGQGPAGAYVHRLDGVKSEALRNALRTCLSLPTENAPFVLRARMWCVRGTVPEPQ